VAGESLGISAIFLLLLSIISIYIDISSVPTTSDHEKSIKTRKIRTKIFGVAFFSLSRAMFLFSL
jgi:hypothetical protein